ncbi:MAG: MFS transporter [Nitriliruptorales bacterium]|nr:MFS transporter [Nitriliruptorales bacterium]
MLLVGGGVLAISIAAFFRVPLLPMIGIDLGMSATQLGLVTTGFAVGRLVIDIPAGRLTNRVQPVPLLAAAAFVLAVGSALFASARFPLWVIGASFVIGVASALTNATGMTFFSLSTTVERRGIALAAFSSALLGGQAVGPLVGGAIADVGGWRQAQAAAAISGLVVCIALLWAGGAPGRWARAGGDGDPGAFHPAGQPVPRSERIALRGVSFAMFFTLGAMPQTLVPVIGAQEFGLSATMIGAALGLGGFCRFVGGLFGGFVSDRVARRAALLPGLVLQAIGVGLIATTSAGGWLAAIVLMSLASWGISVGATVIADRAAPSDVGGLLGTYRFVGDLGLIAGPLATALLYERVGKPAAVLLVAGLLLATALACAVMVPETRWSTSGGRRGAVDGDSAGGDTRPT